MSLVILTGARGAGKTTVCYKTATLARAAGYTCAGVITLSRPDGAREVLDVRTGQIRTLTTTPGSGPVVYLGRFCFDAHVLSWGNEVLANALPCHLLIVDELGPLELELGYGWTQAFATLREAALIPALSLLVVRPELVDKVRLLLPVDTTLVVGLENRDRLPDALVRFLRSSTPPRP
ncbi:MAG: nucleoside-triphosphatase [Anaerolineae bacterium]|nr:nucleoside-triphosphatase [Anaerolineae bacterium]